MGGKVPSRSEIDYFLNFSKEDLLQKFLGKASNPFPHSIIFNSYREAGTILGKEKHKKSEFRKYQNDTKFTFKDFLSKDQIERLNSLSNFQEEKQFHKRGVNSLQTTKQGSLPQKKTNLLVNKTIPQVKATDSSLHNKNTNNFPQEKNFFEPLARVEEKTFGQISSSPTTKKAQKSVDSGFGVNNQEYEAEKVRWINILEKRLYEEGGSGSNSWRILKFKTK